MALQFNHKEYGSLIGSGSYQFRHFGHEIILPSAYQQVEYIVGKGGTSTYIVTDIPGNANKIRIKAKTMDTTVTASTHGYNMFFAVSAGTSGAWVREVLNFNVKSLNVCNGEWIGENTYTLNTLNEWDMTNINNSSSSCTSYKDGVLIATKNQSNVTSTNVFYIMGQNYGGAPHSTYCPAFTGRCYSAKIWLDDILHYDLYPCYQKSDNKSGFYDLVSGTFLSSATSTNFDVGPDWEGRL